MKYKPSATIGMNLWYLGKLERLINESEALKRKQRRKQNKQQKESRVKKAPEMKKNKNNDRDKKNIPNVFVNSHQRMVMIKWVRDSYKKTIKYFKD